MNKITKEELNWLIEFLENTKEELNWLIEFLENTQKDINWKKDKIKIIIKKLKR